jgi:LysM repeat protein
MRRIPLLLLVLSCAVAAVAADAAAQTTPSTRRAPRDTVRAARGDSIRMAEEGNVVSIDELDDGGPAADTVPEPMPGPYARAGGTGPFTVQASGEPATRPTRGEVVWVDTPRPTTRDTARAGGQRVAAGQTTRRDTTSASRPTPRDTARTGGQRVTSGQTARRDTASASRPTTRDTARTGGQRVTSGQTARRDTASATRPTPRDTVRIGSSRVTSGQTTRRDTASTSRPATRDSARRTSSGTTTTTRPGTSTPSGVRPRAHTVASGETFYGIARRYGVTAAQLRALNPDVDMDALEVGDVLRLPAGARDSRPPAQPSRPAAGATQGRTGASAPTPPRGSRTHTVEAGETLFGIARRYGVTVAAIRAANAMETDQVRIGQRLVIPPAR